MSDTGTNVDALAALRAKVFKILVGDATPASAFLSFAPGGLPQSDYTLRFLQDPQYYDEAAIFAQLANSVPGGVGDWVKTSTPLWDVYSDWLNRYEPPPFSLTPEQEKQYREARATLKSKLTDYLKYQQPYDDARTVFNDLALKPKDQRGPNYVKDFNNAKNAMSKAMKNWQILGDKDEFENAYAVAQDLGQRDPVTTKQYLKDQMVAIPSPGNGDYYPTYITPANLLSEGFSWPKFTFTHEEVHTYEKTDSYRWGGSASYGALLWGGSVNTSGKHEYHQKNTDIKNVKIEFELLRAPILRPWFSTFLLRGRGWKWPGSTPENPTGGDPLSGGGVPPNQGNLQMIPTEVIFARNLSVKLDMSSTVNKESLTETKSSAEAGFGFFKIKGEVSTSNGTKSYDFQMDAEGITCEQPQIIGFFCELMPASPNPNWALWPQKEAIAA